MLRETEGFCGIQTILTSRDETYTQWIRTKNRIKLAFPSIPMRAKYSIVMPGKDIYVFGDPEYFGVITNRRVNDKTVYGLGVFNPQNIIKVSA